MNYTFKEKEKHKVNIFNIVLVIILSVLIFLAAAILVLMIANEPVFDIGKGIENSLSAYSDDSNVEILEKQTFRGMFSGSGDHTDNVTVMLVRSALSKQELEKLYNSSKIYSYSAPTQLWLKLQKIIFRREYPQISVEIPDGNTYSVPHPAFLETVTFEQTELEDCYVVYSLYRTFGF